MIAYCGLRCDTCSILLATRETDDEKRNKMRAEIARICKEHYGTELKLEDLTDCDGCKTEGGRLFSGCYKCQIRNCARKKGVENCAHCDEYVCEKLKEFFVKDTETKGRLEEIRSKL